MRGYLTLVRRELGGYFVSMSGYVLLGATLLLLGGSFAILAQLLNTDPSDVPLTELFYKAQFFWLVLLVFRCVARLPLPMSPVLMLVLRLMFRSTSMSTSQLFQLQLPQA